jgi:hypothetical protein
MVATGQSVASRIAVGRRASGKSLAEAEKYSASHRKLAMQPSLQFPATMLEALIKGIRFSGGSST